MITVYALRDAEGVVVYVGMTDNLIRRSAQHRRDSRWSDKFASVEALVTVEDRNEAHEREVAFIRAYRPEFNTANNYDIHVRCATCRGLTTVQVRNRTIAARSECAS